MNDVTSPGAISTSARVSWKAPFRPLYDVIQSPWLNSFWSTWPFEVHVLSDAGSTGGDQSMLFGVSLSFFPLRYNWSYRDISRHASFGRGALTYTSTVASESIAVGYSDSPRICQLICTRSWCGLLSALCIFIICTWVTSCTCSSFV